MKHLTMRSLNKFEIWIADLDPQFGTEPGKKRPVVVVQSDLINHAESNSTIICPITSKLNPESNLLRVHLLQSRYPFLNDSDILVDQVRSIDNRRFVKKIGILEGLEVQLLDRNLKIVLDLG